MAGSQITIEHSNLNRLAEGALNILEFRIAEEYTDETFSLRLAIWKAAYHAFWDAPLFGYGPSERFNALASHLSIEWLAFSHPHNDILAGALSVGLLGIPLVLVCIISPIWPLLLLKNGANNKSIITLPNAIESSWIIDKISKIKSRKP